MSETRADLGPEAAPGERRSAADSSSIAERWYVAITMCVVYTLSICDRYSISTVLEPIRRELHLSDANIAFLTGEIGRAHV